MTTRSPFLNEPYAAYHYRAVPPEDADLTHTGPGTPCGEYFRRFWQPVALSAEVKDLPVRIKIMHEDLVVFRDRRSRVGLLQLHCSHRGTSLEYGQISDIGIRCCYHGWHYDIDGRILDMPTEPPESDFKSRLCHGAYPTQEYKGFIWAYLGPPGRRPPFPRFDIMETDEFDHTDAATKAVWPCNWLQIRDNFMDPLHTVILHTISPEGTGFAGSMAVMGDIEFAETPVGMVYIHARRIGEHLWFRMAENVYPNMSASGLNAEDGSRAHPFNGPEITLWAVPIDDTHTINFRLRHYRSWQPRSEQAPLMAFGQEATRSYEETQRLPGDYDAQVAQRPIAVHALEHLTASDRGIIMWRKRLREGIEAVKRGDDPHPIIRRGGGVIPTYAGDTVLVVPQAATEAEDRKQRLEIGVQLIEEYITAHPKKLSC
jgi:nitrite reductase/ring-hydroxylating ferredoxin subunit